MQDLIRRQAAKEAYCKKFCHPGVLCPDSGFCREVDEAFDPVPSAQHERKKGKWHHCEGMYTCDQCGSSLDDISPFCPMCGADMREERRTDD